MKTTAAIPDFLAPIVEILKKEKFNFNQEEAEVKPPPKSFEEKAVWAAHEALRHALSLEEKRVNLSEAAREVEKIQVAAAEAERAAFISHTPRAKKCSHLADRIALLSREFLHELKESNEAKKVA
jgi:hypothetical protein